MDLAKSLQKRGDSNPGNPNLAQEAETPWEEGENKEKGRSKERNPKESD